MGAAFFMSSAVTAQAPVKGTPLPQVGNVLPLTEDVTYKAPQRAPGDEIAHWTLNTFSDFVTFMEMTQINVDDDESGWSASSTGSNLNVICSSTTERPNDDWLITLPFTLEAGKRYEVSVQLRARNAERKLEIFAGQENTVEGMTIRLTDVMTVTTDSYHMYKGSFLAPTSGEYMAGFHEVSDPAQSCYTYLADIIVKETVPADAPCAVTGLAVTPGENGALSADISFTLPTTTLGGDALAAIEKVELLCNGEVVQTWTDVNPGESVNYNDIPASGGEKTYSVLVYNEAGPGEAAETTVWVGYDVPVAPSNVVLSAENPDNMLLSWSPSTTGVHNYFFDPDNVWYNIYSSHTSNDGYSTLGELILTTEVGATSIQLGKGIDEGEERGLNCYAVKGVNISGEGPFQGSNYLLIGSPYPLPFEDNFADGMSQTYWLGSGSGLGYEYGLAGTGIRPIDSSESGGALFMQTFFGDTIQGHSFKIDLSEARDPYLSFKRMTEDDGMALLVLVYNASMDHIEVIYEEDIPMASFWQDLDLSLAAFAGEPRYIQIAFTAVDTEFANDFKYLNITDVVVYDKTSTGVEEITTRDIKGDNTVYSIDGRVMGHDIDALPHGIYIQNGKKVLK